MDAKIVNPFIVSAVNLFQDMAGLKLNKGKAELGKGRRLISGFGVSIGITGDVAGKVLYEFPDSFATSITEMLNEKKAHEFDSEEEFSEMRESTLNEIGNMISGGAVTMLGDEGYDCDITPPGLLHGKDIEVISRDQSTIMVPFQTSIGFITINIAVRA